MKKRYTDEQIVGFLKEAETGIKPSELARKHGFSEASFSLWKRRFGGLEVNDAKLLRQLQNENERLKRKLAEAILDADVLKEALTKKW